MKLMVSIQVYWPWTLFLGLLGYISLKEPPPNIKKNLDVFIKVVIFEILEMIIEIGSESNYQ